MVTLELGNSFWTAMAMTWAQVWRMRSRRSEDSLVGSTTRASSSSSSVWAASSVASGAADVGAVEEERTAVCRGLHEKEKDWREAKPRGEAAVGQRSGEKRIGR